MTAKLEFAETTFDFVSVKFPINGQPLRLPDNGMTRDEFFDFCQNNNSLQIERTADRYLIIMPPTASETGINNANITIVIGNWNLKTKSGHVFDSSTGFTLTNGAERSPDTAWIKKERWEALPAAEKKKFAQITPDFVVELRSAGQGLSSLRDKMEEYMECGCRLGWLIDPQNKRTYVYTENGDIQTVAFDTMLYGGDVMIGLEVVMGDVIV
jgi:Uma2 family endonuclease